MSRKQLKGKIKAWSGAQTVSVEVGRVFHHPRYRKRLRASKTYLAHLEGEAEVGQNVVIEESRPISKRKHWVVVEVGGKSLATPQQVKRTRSKEDRYSRQRGDKKEKGRDREVASFGSVKVKGEEPRVKEKQGKKKW